MSGTGRKRAMQSPKEQSGALKSQLRQGSELQVYLYIRLAIQWIFGNLSLEVPTVIPRKFLVRFLNGFEENVISGQRSIRIFGKRFMESEMTSILV